MPGAYTSPRCIGKIRVLKDFGLSNVEIAQKVSRNRRTVDRIVEIVKWWYCISKKEKWETEKASKER